jgi:hypothetical protein
VKGKVYIAGGNATINSTISGNVEGQIGSLTLGSNAVINGNLSYQSENKAVISKGAIIRGKNEFKKLEEPKNQPTALNTLLTTGSLYKLAIEILISLILIIFLPVLLKNLLERIINAPLGMAGYGFLFLIFWPMFSLFLLFLLWLGLASFLFYGLVIIFVIFLSKIISGWWLMQWWEKRSNKKYSLDWKAGVAGPIAFFILGLIPVFGWFITFIIFLMSLGSITKYLLELLKTQKH